MKSVKMSVGVILLMQACSLWAGVSDIYCHLFGGQDASEWYQETTRQALVDFGHPDPDQVGIKQMNELGPLCIGNDLYSFSMFNIWYNEDILDVMDEQERVFAIYREVAHVVQKHHQQLLLSFVPAALLFVLIPSMHKRFFGEQPRLVRYSAYMIEWVISGFAIDKAWFRPWVKNQEKWADQEAARILSSIGRQDVVDAHINLLDQEIDFGYQAAEDWHYSLKDQAAYLRTYKSNES